MKIIFTGDLFLGGDLLDNNKETGISCGIFEKADYIISNLEQAVSNGDYEEDKCTLWSNTNALELLIANKSDTFFFKILQYIDILYFKRKETILPT